MSGQVVLDTPADQQASPIRRIRGDFDGREVSSVAKPCDHAKNLKISLIVLAIIGLVVGVVGLLSNIGVLNIGLNGVGTLEGMNALYTMLGGFGGTLVATAIFTVLQLRARYNANKGSSAHDDLPPESPSPIAVHADPANVGTPPLAHDSDTE